MEKYLWLKITEKVERNIGLKIGEDITQEEANKFLAIKKEDVEVDSEEFQMVSHRIGIGGEQHADNWGTIEIWTEEEE